MIEAWWRSLKHQWLFLPPAGQCRDRPSTRRLLMSKNTTACFLMRPFAGRPPDEMYFGSGPTVPADLKSGAVAARRARREANRSGRVRQMPLDRCGRMSTEEPPPDRAGDRGLSALR
jgi:hypothetical protein